MVKRKANPKKRLRSIADKLWYEAYLKDECEVCGERGYLQAHHFYYKGSYGYFRYSQDNHITLCRKCHFILHHQDPKKITEQIIDKRGQEWYNELRKQTIETYYSFQTVGWYKQNIDKLQEYLNETNL